MLVTQTPSPKCLVCKSEAFGSTALLTVQVIADDGPEAIKFILCTGCAEQLSDELKGAL
jgi:hypothetical protein